MKTILKYLVAGVLMLAMLWSFSFIACIDARADVCSDDVLSQTIIKIIK